MAKIPAYKPKFPEESFATVGMVGRISVEKSRKVGDMSLQLRLAHWNISPSPVITVGEAQDLVDLLRKGIAAKKAEKTAKAEDDYDDIA